MGDFEDFVKQGSQLSSIMGGPDKPDRRYLQKLWDASEGGDPSERVERANNQLMAALEKGEVQAGGAGGDSGPAPPPPSSGGGGKSHKKEKKHHHKHKESSPPPTANGDFGSGHFGGADAFGGSAGGWGQQPAHQPGGDWGSCGGCGQQMPPQQPGMMQPPGMQPNGMMPQTMPGMQPNGMMPPQTTLPAQGMQMPPTGQPQGWNGGQVTEQQIMQTQQDLMDLTKQIEALTSGQAPPGGNTFGGPQPGQLGQPPMQMGAFDDESDSDSENDWWHLPAPGHRGGDMNGMNGMNGAGYGGQMGMPGQQQMQQPMPQGMMGGPQQFGTNQFNSAGSAGPFWR
eukprot:TRINITY_DN20888_c0_g1_i1.p1 TRINITY_DN20888_c0_g1~~TRINITY_DN20888_c0_g1_i1.p1  ORF type:complete len:340 (+),score=102.90 TRINITY_DN20888_c0_g1_i1:152-1171(+)